MSKQRPEADPAAGRRYRFLETVRQYGRERLLRSGEAEQARDRHLAFFLAMARRVEPELMQVNQALWLNRVQLVHDDIRSALDWSLATPERAELGLELVARLWWFWTKRGYFIEARQRIERALAAAPVSSPGIRAKALIGLGHMTAFEGDNARTMVLLEECLALAREAGDYRTMALTFGFQALTAAERGDFERCESLAADGLAAAAQSGDLWFRALPLRMLGYAAMHAGDYDRASASFEESISLLRQTGEKWGLGILLGDLAGLRLLQSRYPDARALGREAIFLCEELGDRRGVAWSLATLATAEAAEGRRIERRGSGRVGGRARGHGRAAAAHDQARAGSVPRCRQGVDGRTGVSGGIGSGPRHVAEASGPVRRSTSDSRRQCGVRPGVRPRLRPRL